MAPDGLLGLGIAVAVVVDRAQFRLWTVARTSGGKVVSFSLNTDWMLLVVVIGLLYLWGIRRAAHAGYAPPRARRVAFYSGMVVLLVAMASPLDAYVKLSFLAFTAQHILLIFVVAPLLALGAPVTVATWASPESVRRRFIRPALEGRVVSFLTHPIVAWTVFATLQLVFRSNALFTAALTKDPIPPLERLLSLSTACLLWWPIVRVDPPEHSVASRVAAVCLMLPVEGWFGLSFLRAARPLFSFYRSLPDPWGHLGALESQQNAGILILVSSVVVVLVAAMLVIWRNRPAEPAQIDPM